jgi:serine beta-lactamase-like protein LACTB
MQPVRRMSVGPCTILSWVPFFFAIASQTMHDSVKVRSLFARGALLIVLVAQTAAAWALDGTRVTRYLQRLQAQSGAPGVSAAILVRGELVFSGGVGLSDLEAGTAQNGVSVHNIGSISKTHAVVAVMQLVEQGKVDLDAEVQTYAPWFPKKQAPITVRQILTHTSGIRHYKDGEFGEGGVLAFRQFDNVEESTRRWRDEPLLFTPGQYWNYSSFATNLLQAVVESASGEKFEDYLRRQVWVPAGMLDTQFDVPSRIVPRRGSGYERDEKSHDLINAVQENVSYKYAGGGIISTDEDLVRFGQALNAGLLLKPATLTEMYRPQLRAGIQYPPDVVEAFTKANPGKPVPQPRLQALIWHLATDGEGRRYPNHGGSVKGTLSQLSNFKDQQVVVAVHVNAWAGGVDLEEAAEALAKLVLESPKATTTKAK